MGNLARIFVFVAACLVAADTALALDPHQPFVRVTVPDGVVDLGGASGPGWKQLTAQLVANVVANCGFHMEASFTGLAHSKGRTVISPKHMQVQINGQPVSVGTGRVEVAARRRPTGTQGVEVPIDLQVGVTGLDVYPVGQYRGALVIRVVAMP